MLLRLFPLKKAEILEKHVRNEKDYEMDLAVNTAEVVTSSRDSSQTRSQLIWRKPTRKELPVDIEPVSEIDAELDAVSPVIEATIRNYEFEYEDLLRKRTWKF